jgi:hypothetical protein
VVGFCGNRFTLDVSDNIRASKTRRILLRSSGWTHAQASIAMTRIDSFELPSTGKLLVVRFYHPWPSVLQSRRILILQHANQVVNVACQHYGLLEPFMGFLNCRARLIRISSK